MKMELILTVCTFGFIILVLLYIIGKQRNKIISLRSLVEAYKWKDTESDKIIDSLKQTENLLTLEVKEWKLKATAPTFDTSKQPIILHKENLQKICLKTELDSFPIMREKAIRQGIDKLSDFIAPMVYSEIAEDVRGRKVLYQEIWVGLSEKFNK